MHNPESRLQAAVAGWEHPVSRVWMAVADLFDMQLSSKSKRKPKPYPRPYDKTRTRIGGKKKALRTPDELRALLARPRKAK